MYIVPIWTPLPAIYTSLYIPLLNSFQRIPSRFTGIPSSIMHESHKFREKLYGNKWLNSVVAMIEANEPWIQEKVAGVPTKNVYDIL